MFVSTEAPREYYHPVKNMLYNSMFTYDLFGRQILRVPAFLCHVRLVSS